MKVESKTTAPAETAWRRFPCFERCFGDAAQPVVLERIESTCRRLDALTRSSSPQDRTRATAAMAGYGRLMDLVQAISRRVEETA